MSTITSPNTRELSPNHDENSQFTITEDDHELILENTSSDVTITKSELSSNLPTVPSTTTTSMSTMKTQVLPLVYIQTQSKVPYTTINKTGNSNVLLNNIPIQLAALGTNIVNKNSSAPLTNVTVPNNQNVIFAPINNSGNTQQLVIQKQTGNVLPIVPVSVASAYLTMFKHGNKLQVNSSTTNVMQTTSTQKYVIAPLPKVTSNRLPSTVTTNTVQNKIALMPAKQILNFKISDGQIQSENSSVTVMCDNQFPKNADKMDVGTDSETNLECNELIDLVSPEKKPDNLCEISLVDKTPVKNDVMIIDTVNVSKQTPEPKIPIQRDLPKFVKHGISILKKNYVIADRKTEKPSNLIINNNSKLPVSDTAQRDIILTKPSTGTEETILLTGTKLSSNKTERRRKSNFSYRKDYDDMEITSFDNKVFPFNKSFENSDVTVTKLCEPDHEESKDVKSDFLEIEVVKDKTDINMNDDCDLQKILKWDEGIGTLPGSDLKFIINEFNIVEYVTQDEYNKIIERRIAKAKEKIKNEFEEDMRCEECGCYGLPSEFISPKYCSYDCQEAGDNKLPREKDRFKRKKKKGFNNKRSDPFPVDNIKNEKYHSGSEDENTSNENSQDKFLYPWACTKKGFSWSKYLDHIKAKSAPVKLFKDPFPYSRNAFRPGMKLEGIDPQHPSYFCVLTVAEICGYRIRLHFDGYLDNYDFWVNADSMDIFPMGWCEKYGHVLQPPPGYTIENFNWVQYLKYTKSSAAPKHLFTNRAGNAICPNGFRVGMKLEAVDRKNTSLVCVASVRDMMDNRILVHFDSWDDIYDYWADPTSPYIHPVGWCDQYGHNLTPPNDYPSPETFAWNTYLKETKAVAAPVRAFKQRPACGFKPGMRLECVDRRVPQLIRVATVDDVREHQIRIHFDGWPDRYSYWMDDDSPDIHPVGWCQKTGHPIEPPLTPDDVYDFLECPTVGCRGQGDVRGPKFPTHSTQKHCPYAEENIDVDRILPDRLLSPDRTIEAVVPVSREPKEKIKARLGRPPKYARLDNIKVEPRELNQEFPEKKQKRKYRKRLKLEQPESIESKAMTLIEQSNVVPAELKSWPKHSKFLKNYTSVEDDPKGWTNMEVVDFIASLPSCQKEADIFKAEEIDGEALLSLSQKDILRILKVKVGPAVKIYNSIVLLRQHAKSFDLML